MRILASLMLSLLILLPTVLMLPTVTPSTSRGLLLSRLPFKRRQTGLAILSPILGASLLMLGVYLPIFIEVTTRHQTFTTSAAVRLAISVWICSILWALLLFLMARKLVRSRLTPGLSVSAVTGLLGLAFLGGMLLLFRQDHTDGALLAGGIVPILEAFLLWPLSLMIEQGAALSEPMTAAVVVLALVLHFLAVPRLAKPSPGPRFGLMGRSLSSWYLSTPLLLTIVRSGRLPRTSEFRQLTTLLLVLAAVVPKLIHQDFSTTVSENLYFMTATLLSVQVGLSAAASVNYADMSERMGAVRRGVRAWVFFAAFAQLWVRGAVYVALISLLYGITALALAGPLLLGANLLSIIAWFVGWRLLPVGVYRTAMDSVLLVTGGVVLAGTSYGLAKIGWSMANGCLVAASCIAVLVAGLMFARIRDNK
jgi:hypothetical protein